MTEVKVIGRMDNTMDNTFESANRVYDIHGIAPTIPTCGGGGIQPKVLEVRNEVNRSVHCSKSWQKSTESK